MWRVLTHWCAQDEVEQPAAVFDTPPTSTVVAPVTRITLVMRRAAWVATTLSAHWHHRKAPLTLGVPGPAPGGTPWSTRTDESEQVMQFGIIPPVRAGVTADPGWMASFSRHAEDSGFESVVLVEHAVVISDYVSTYPYAPSGRMPLPDDCPIPDPLDLMAYLAGMTTGITLATGVLVLPNHQAVVLAKRIATVDVLSGGRVRMCVGVGWMDEELQATGADPRSRGRRTDETIAAMRGLWADSGPGGADFDGEFVSFHRAHSYPKPVQSRGRPAPYRWPQRGCGAAGRSPR